MSLLLESEAQFTARAREIGLSNETVQAVKDAGANTLSTLAFAVGQPGQPIATQEADNFLRAALGRDPTLAESNGIRRLAFEAQTLLVASLRQVVEHRDDGAPKRIGAAERKRERERDENECNTCRAWWLVHSRRIRAISPSAGESMPDPGEQHFEIH